MVVYEITAEVQKELIEKFEKFMQEKHIPDMIETGYFIGAEMSRFSENYYRIRYEAADITSLDEYFSKDAERLQKDFLSEFPKGISLSREILGVLWVWKKN